MFQAQEDSNEVAVVRDSFNKKLINFNDYGKSKKAIEKCKVMCCSKDVFVGLCDVYRKTAYRVAIQSREKKEKLVIFRA